MSGVFPPDVASVLREHRGRLRALEAVPPVVVPPIVGLEWAIFVSTSFNLVGSTVAFDIYEAVFADGAVRSNGPGWAVEPIDQERIEVGDAGNYYALINFDFGNSASAAKTLYLGMESYYFDGSGWTLDAGLQTTPLRSGPGQPYGIPLGGVASSATYQVGLIFGVLGAIDGGFTVIWQEDDQANPVSQGAVTVTLFRLPGGGL